MDFGTKEYFAEVRHELQGIKKHAMHDEIQRLNIHLLHPAQTQKCIYGLMTGYCYSARANELIQQLDLRYHIIGVGDFSVIDKGKPSIQHLTREVNTFLEHCIIHYPGNNENIIKFLKGEQPFITLKPK